MLLRNGIWRMRTTVFDVTGQTGHPLVEQAVERGHDVVALVRDAIDFPSTLWNDGPGQYSKGDAYTTEGVDQLVTLLARDFSNLVTTVYAL